MKEKRKKLWVLLGLNGDVWCVRQWEDNVGFDCQARLERIQHINKKFTGIILRGGMGIVGENKISWCFHNVCDQKK